jgi:dephospho-CoA kinase
MLLVGLTGGIGSGKSTVAEMLGEQGAIVIDADDLARRAVDPGTSGFERLVGEFGERVLDAAGGLDRAALAEVVFRDPEARRRLEKIVHPEVARLFAEQAARYRDTDRVVVYSVPLLVEAGLRDAFDLVVTVETSEEARAGRLEAGRGMSKLTTRERMDAQATDEERRQAAHIVIGNDGSLDDLRRAVEALWPTLRDRAGSS